MTDSDPSYAADEYTATVTWGDGNQDVATVTGSNGVFSVVATHAYTEEGSYTATVAITDPNGITTQTVSDTVSVADAALTASSFSTPVTLTQGVAANGVVLAQFNDANTSETPSTFTASINWGDGNTTAGVVGGAGGLYSISGSHTYAAAGSYTATVTVTDIGGSQVVISTPVTVSATPQYEVAQFSDPNQGDTASQFSASITWGDGGSGSGTVVGGNGSFTVMASHVYGEEGTYTVTTTIAGPGGPLAVQGTAQVGDPFLSGSSAPPTPPQAPPPAAVVPEIGFNFETRLTYFPIMNRIAANPPGLRVHIDDNFFMQAFAPGSQSTLVADNRINSVNPAVDSNLVQGTITIGPAGSQGTLFWTIPNSVRVWWQPLGYGPWELVKSGGLPIVNYKAWGLPTPIRIQGISPDSGATAKITASYEIQGQANPAATASFFYNVYTGLNVSGNAAPQSNFIQQLEQASGYGLTVDGSGKVWRTTEPAFMTANQKYMGVFAGYLDTILTNPMYLSYNVETPTMMVTAFATPNNIPWLPDNNALKVVYPDNIAAISTGPNGVGKTNGPKFAAGLIVHALQEQYEMQIRGLQLEVNPKAKPDHAVGGAMGAGVYAEEAVLGWGVRQLQPIPPAAMFNGQLIEVLTYTFTNQNNGVTQLIVAFAAPTLQFRSATVNGPGQ